MAEAIFIKKNRQNHGILVYKKVLISEHRKNYIFRDNNYFYQNVSLVFVHYTFTKFLLDALVHNRGGISKRNFTYSFGALRLRAD